MEFKIADKMAVIFNRCYGISACQLQTETSYLFSSFAVFSLLPL